MNLNVSPSIPTNNVSDSYRMDPKHFRDASVCEITGCVKFFALFYLAGCEYCLRKLLSFWVSISIFLEHVARIFFGRSKEKMAWINAGPVVALVKNPHSIWNISLEQSPRRSVGRSKFFKVEKTIPVHILTPIPFPALVLISHFYFCTKSFFRAVSHFYKVGTIYNFSTV